MIIATPLTPEQRADLVAKLADARNAYHTLAIGAQARVIVDQNGERVEFTAAKKGDLYTYIMSLESQLATLPAALRVAGPAGFIF
jgi:hypothetical protein